MNIRIILSLVISLSAVSISFAQITVTTDTIFITGGTLSGKENTGLLESTINGDTTKSGNRVNPNRVYALNEGQVYYQNAPINVYNPNGTLTIVGIPSVYGNTKPIILIEPSNGVDVIVYPPSGCSNSGGGVNEVYGSLKFENIHYQTMQLDGFQNPELFYCGTANRLPQSLTIHNCQFEFCNIDLFDCTNEQGAIGGWQYGAKFRITNSYFRNMFNPRQWWGSRVFQCRHSIDTLWIENCTVTTSGLTFLQQNELTDFAYFNHNTIINNHKYWILSAYYKNLIVTNNIFVNQNWVGEDTNVIASGENPYNTYQSTIDIYINNANRGLRVYLSNNVNYYDPKLIKGYYTNSTYVLPSLGTPPSYLRWYFPVTPNPVNNIPCAWMNAETKTLFNLNAPPKGNLIEENTTNEDPHLSTPAIADESVVTMMAQWNQNLWGDPRFATPPDIVHSKYIYGDFDPTTLPGLINGKHSDAITAEGPGIQVGIRKFTDLTENFSQNTVISKLDSLPVGSLIWDDAKLAAFNSTNDLNAVNRAYVTAGGSSLFTGIKEITNLSHTYSLLQNYPNPFNPTTIISWQLAVGSFVTLKVYDVLGREVKILVNELQSAGIHSVTFNAASLSSGIYIYRIEAGEFRSAMKMTVLK
jgi:hypothetical protein